MERVPSGQDYTQLSKPPTCERKKPKEVLALRKLLWTKAADNMDEASRGPSQVGS